MYVAKRSFRNYGKMIAPGSIVEPDAIKRFKQLLSDNHIVEVGEHNFNIWQDYFKKKFGVDIKSEEVEKIDEPSNIEEPSKTKEPSKNKEKAIKVTAKAK